ncbi:hypothetical protein ACTMTJ_15595 [Phytohabitans sp. LJ34]
MRNLEPGPVRRGRTCGTDLLLVALALVSLILAIVVVLYLASRAPGYD